jgi:hypothetical protein
MSKKQQKLDLLMASEWNQVAFVIPQLLPDNLTLLILENVLLMRLTIQ